MDKSIQKRKTYHNPAVKTVGNKNKNISTNRFNGFNQMIMSHSYNRIWIHAIWATKERMPIMTADIESKIHKIISDQLHELGCPLRIINGMPDHIHSLFLLNSQKSIAEVMKQIKGSSSHTINQSDLLKQKFSWQTGYAAFSVSESVAERVYHYIKNQKAHHQKKTFQNEYNSFVKVNGLQNE